MIKAAAVPATILLFDAADRRWEVLVVGAGPAGAMAAHQLARSGVKVMLLDRDQFPRGKVCGCCLNAAALDVLKRFGLPDPVKALGGAALRDFQIACGGRTATVPIPGGAAISRGRFDAALVTAAIDAGAAFLPGARAIGAMTACDGVSVAVATDSAQCSIFARVVIAADGLSGGFLRRSPGFEEGGADGARIGAGATFSCNDPAYSSGRIFMAAAAAGYAGLVRLENGALDVAAAFDPPFVRCCGGLAAAAERVIQRAGFPAVEGLREARWRGTAALTRHVCCVARDRIFVIGDSAGYVEPFTGEGMACALACGALIAPVVQRALSGECDVAEREWRSIYARQIAPRHRRCRMLTRWLRQPAVTAAAIAALQFWPALAGPLTRRMNRSFA